MRGGLAIEEASCTSVAVERGARSTGGLTLEAGDIIATGTPSGVGFARKPPEFLKHGDVVETEITGLGVMRNTIRSEA
jgi:2-keto-4-pentenoate hydratase/2-oxohepta-3-ene-1,7-dioic acid hydratase in catechol pathway